MTPSNRQVVVKTVGRQPVSRVVAAAITSSRLMKSSSDHRGDGSSVIIRSRPVMPLSTVGSKK